MTDSPAGDAVSRRRFLSGLAQTAAALGLAQAGIARADDRTQPPPATSRPGPMKLLLPAGMVYLNNGSLGPTPRSVMDATMAAWRELEADPVGQAYGPMLKRMEHVRAKAAALLGCETAEVAFTRNTTEGMSAVAQGLHLTRGQRVLTTDQEHPGGLTGWTYYARRVGVAIDTVRLPAPPRSADQIVPLLAARIRRDTRVISVSHVTYPTGLRMPIRRIAALAEARGVLLVVDGAQAPGVLAVDVRRLGCHAYATSGHKWLLGPKGTGLLYIRKTARKLIDPLLLADGPRAYTAATGTRNTPGILGLGAAIDLLGRIGAAAIERRAVALRNRAYEGLGKLAGVKLVSPPPGVMASAMVTVALPEGVDSAALARALRSRHRVVVKAVPKRVVNGIRISTHVYNTERDVDRLLAALRKELA